MRSCLFFQPKIVEALLGYELVQVSCGASHVLAVTNEREVFAWGRGDNGTVKHGGVFILTTLVFTTRILYADLLQQYLSISKSCPRFLGRLGLGTQDTHSSPQQVCLPVEFEAQRVVCGVDCSMIIGTQYNIVACGSNR